MLAEDVYKAGFGAVVAGAFLVDLFHLDVVGVACQDGVQECPLDGSQGQVFNKEEKVLHIRGLFFFVCGVEAFGPGGVLAAAAVVLVDVVDLGVVEADFHEVGVVDFLLFVVRFADFKKCEAQFLPEVFAVLLSRTGRFATDEGIILPKQLLACVPVPFLPESDKSPVFFKTSSLYVIPFFIACNLSERSFLFPDGFRIQERWCEHKFATSSCRAIYEAYRFCKSEI